MIGALVSPQTMPTAQPTASAINRVGAARQVGMNALPGVDATMPGGRMPSGVRASPGNPSNPDQLKRQLAEILGNY